MMAFDDIVTTGAATLNKGDKVNIVTSDGTFFAGPFTVVMAICVIGDWIHLQNADGSTYLEGNLRGGDNPADLSHLPAGWRFETLARA